ncbi:PaaI family thioesterase [Stappia indica]|uniref:PaaI family thioesterase n=1 Tax=Stappia indica TaxID=538381 RepID=UPI001CD76FA1|nr:PaaI family thioesterase [Stappia indica]MCA1297834.1 PaaI family thioesterase [Stappia indica]
MDFQERTFGLADRAETATMTGLAMLRAMLDGRFPAPPICQTMNFILTEVEDGSARFEGEPGFAHYNPMGMVHGGWIATILDSALGCAVHTTLQPGEGYTTIEFKVNNVRPLFQTSGRVICDGTVLHRGRRMATSEARLVDENGKLIAHGVETCMIFPAGETR